MRVFLVVTKPLAGLTNSDVAFGNLFEKNQAKLYLQELVAGLATGSMKPLTRQRIAAISQLQVCSVPSNPDFYIWHIELRKPSYFE